jgi:hypothetical protein
MPNNALPTLVLLASLMATAAAAGAVETAPDAGPMKIESCSASEQSVLENPKIGIRTAQVSGVTIVYTNESAIAATDVRFRVRYGGATYTVDDRGALAAGRKISREFTSIDASYRGTAADCSVLAVTFADGTSWSATASLAPAAPGHR